MTTKNLKKDLNKKKFTNNVKKKQKNNKGNTKIS